MKLKTHNQRVVVISAVLIFTALSAFSAISTYEIAKRSSEESLKSTAYFIGITLDQALNRTGIDEGLISEIIKKQRSEQIAYISLYDKDRKIVLHSNPRMTGQTVTEPFIENVPQFAYVTLKTGEQVYVMNIPVHIHSFAPMVLSIALHTYPSMEAVRSAKVHMLILIGIVTAMWTLAFMFIYYLKKTDLMEKKALVKERFAAVGEMAAVLAHEIRTPLSSIKGFAQYLSEKLKDNDRAAEGLSVIVNESSRLENLTNDLLVYAKPPEIKIQSLSLRQLIDEVIGVFTLTDEIETNIVVSNDTINSDREKLKQILINIISNAVDSIEKSGKIYITVTESKRMITFTIKDTGKGMDASALKDASRPFFTTKTKGTGLGLSIVDNLVNVMEGKLLIESQPSHGTTVTITIPCVRDDNE
ncbi:sensor histidine kinase [Candidatus Magnetomonas plexicatena]|uniref:sensor histidine kinase n=1 Tax=Candidatus Magnetomonas plexicatena TaxID=2552947 RepID=UPI001C798D05|nr:GHKL domain-containing protein [Nitrospirales bacterium LBB_01]